jgi:hypothetical protein
MEILISNQNVNKHDYRINCHEKLRHQEGIVINLKTKNYHQLSSIENKKHQGKSRRQMLKESKENESNSGLQTCKCEF